MFRPSAPQQGGLDTGLSNNTDGSGRLPVPRGAGMKPRGFTILEILAVISVIAILVGFSIPKFKGMLDEGKVSKAKRELKTFTAAIESYAMHHQRALPSNITTDLVGALPQMIEAVLIDPFSPNGSDTYQYSKNGNYYAIWSVGPNGTNETADITSSGEVPTSGDDYVQTNGTTTALDTETDEANCGSIGTECSGTTDTCTGGTCLCGADPECGAGQSCMDGACACDDGDLTICSGACVDTETDNDNCGGCGTECSGTTDTCTGGTCLCGADPECGAGQSCMDGACACDDGDLTICSGACVDTETDNDNCGGCGDECEEDEVCFEGACALLYTVTYDGNSNTGGTAPEDTDEYLENATVTVLANTGSLERTGYTFDGWNTASDGGGTDYAQGTTFSMGSANVTLYAKWADACAGSPAVGTVCADGTLYVNATLRTTPSDAGIKQWSTQNIVTGATNTADGAANTATLAGLAGVYPAADYCAALSFGGHEDWYLPAKDELAVLRVNRVALGGNQTDWYWSSTENASNYAWGQNFSNGYQSYRNKTSNYDVRCVRSP